MFQYQAVIQRVIDGDTVVADIDLGFGVWQHVTCRLLGINAPEMSTAAGVTAKSALASLVQGRKLEVRSSKDRRDKYGRYLLTIMMDETTSVNDWLVSQKYAVPYMV